MHPRDGFYVFLGARRARWAVLLALALAFLGLGASGLHAQSDPIVVRSEGGNTGFPDADDPERIIWVFFGGVDIAQGDRRMRGDTLVAVLKRSAHGTGKSKIGAGESVLPGSRVLELFVDGDVTLEEKNERIVGAKSIYVDNEKGTLTVLEGESRSTFTDTPVVVRYRIMRQMADGVRELEGASYTTCDFAHAHWSLDTPWTRMIPTDEGRILHTSWNSAHLGGIPFLWLPALHFNIDKAEPPLRGVGFGSSRRLGTEIRTKWGGDASQLGAGVGRLLGTDSPVDAKWELELNNYSSRGVFYQPKWSYETERSKGELFGSYIYDHNRRDELDQPIFDNTRGRIDLEHRTRLDDHRTVDVELSYVSDGEYLSEFYEHEDRVGKQQETYVSYRDVEDNEALTVLTRARLNRHQTQVEYLPRVERRLSGEQVDTGWFGTAYFNSVDFVDSAALRAEQVLRPDFPADQKKALGTATPPPKPTQPDSQRNIRAGTRGTLLWPLDVGDDRVTVSAGYDITGFETSARTQDPTPGNAIDTSVTDQGGAIRYAALGGVEWVRTYSGSAPYESDLWNMQGVRQILEPRVGYQGVFEANHGPEDFFAIDTTEELANTHAFTVGVRHRVQTHQNDKVVTTLDTDISMPFFPNEDRDNLVATNTKAGTPEGQTRGLVTIDTLWKPGADIVGLRESVVRWRSRYNPQSWASVDSFASYSSPFGENQRVLIAHNKSRRVSDFLTAGVQWVLTPRWTFAAYNQRDLLLNENSKRGIILSQQAHRWLIDIELSRRRGRSTLPKTPGGGADRLNSRADTRFSISFRPSFAAQSETLLDRLGKVR